MTDLPEYVLERVFDAPRDLVWRAWTEPELLSRWYGPGVETIIHKLDVRSGGTWHNEMRMSNMSQFERIDYLEVVRPARLVWLHAVVNDAWQNVPNPMMPDWPAVLHTTVTFDEVDGNGTKLRLTWVPHKASEAEIACFAAAIAGLDRGWGKGMEVLAEILAELQA